MGKLLNQTDWKPSKNAVKAATPAPFKPYVVPQNMLDAIARTTEYRKVGKSWEPGK